VVHDLVLAKSSANDPFSNHAMLASSFVRPARYLDVSVWLYGLAFRLPVASQLSSALNGCHVVGAENPALSARVISKASLSRGKSDAVRSRPQYASLQCRHPNGAARDGMALCDCRDAGAPGVLIDQDYFVYATGH
jgi:hypothetical protein